MSHWQRDPQTLAGSGTLVAIAPVRALRTDASPSRYSLNCAGHVVRLPEGETVLGRAPEATVLIDSPGVSRRHARIVVAGSRVTIEDLGSRNGTWVGRDRIDSAREIPESSVIRIGPVWFLLQSVEER